MAKTTYGGQSRLTGSAAAPQDTAAVQSAIRMAFVDTFKMVMIVCAVLAWVGAALAGLFVERSFRPER